MDDVSWGLLRDNLKPLIVLQSSVPLFNLSQVIQDFVEGHLLGAGVLSLGKKGGQLL